MYLNKPWRAEWMSEEHILLQDLSKKFFEAELVPNIERWEEQRFVDREFWIKAGDAGLLGASIPEEYGGSGGGHGHDAIITYEHSLTGETGWAWDLVPIVAHYILEYGTDEQKHRWLPGLASGHTIPALAMTEPGAGSDIQGIQTTAVKDGNHYVLNGSKTFISNGQLADLIVVVAKTDAKGKRKGENISLIVLETEGAEGFVRGRNLKKLGIHAQDTSELFFEDVHIPHSNLLGEIEGQGFPQLMSQLGLERLLCAVGGLASSDKVLADTLEYVKERKAFGQRIMDFQNTRFKLAEAKTKIEVTRSFIDSAMGLLIAGNLDAATAAMAKWWGSQIQCEIVDECLQLFGGHGYMLEYPVARAYADSRIQKIYGGTNEIMKEIVARSLDS